jgi:hypothetical protein
MKHLILIFIFGIFIFPPDIPEREQLKPCTPLSTDRAQFSAQVTSDKALFIIPVDARPEWHWRNTTTPANACEYQWAVAVHNNTDYEFGCYLFKWADSEPRQGDFDTLISEAQKTVWENNKTEGRVMNGVFVDVLPCHDRIIITIKGRDNIVKLFSNHPAQVTFKIKLPGKELISKEASVLYQE